jgi:mono/diheme cytochrome c family protein
MTQPRREFVLWMAIAIAALVMFALILRLQYQNTQNRFAISVAPQPAQGNAVFRTKGCAKCHGESAAGGELGPALRQRAASLPQLVTAMWNHAPRMYEAMNQAKLPYPSLNYDETGQLVAYLYLTGFSDEPGDPARGQQLFVTKNCARCHSSEGKAGAAPTVQELARADSPLTWTQVLWNHASAMESSMRGLGIAWPRFQANELRDLFAYLRQHGEVRPPNRPSRPRTPTADGRSSRRSTASTVTRFGTLPRRRWCMSAVRPRVRPDRC